MANLSEAFRDHYEVVVLRESTLEKIAKRTNYTEGQLREILRDANARNHVVVYTLHRLEKLN